MSTVLGTTRKVLRAGFFLPSRNLTLSIPIAMAIGFVFGLRVDPNAMMGLVFPVTLLMIYSSMIGFRLADLANVRSGRLLFTSLGINFLVVPMLAYLLGVVILALEPSLFAGLAIASLLPTSNMTISFTMLGGGNVPAAVALTVVSLVLGAILAPGYLLVMVGRSVPLDLGVVFQTIGSVVFIPLALGLLSYSLLLRRCSRQEFAREVKPVLAAVTAWGLVYITAAGMSANARKIVANPDALLVALGAQVLFYSANYAVAILIGRRFFTRDDALTLVFTTVLRNLSISLGLAATVFGPDAAMMVATAFVFQGQSAAWFLKLEKRRPVFARAPNVVAVAVQRPS